MLNLHLYINTQLYMYIHTICIKLCMYILYTCTLHLKMLNTELPHMTSNSIPRYNPRETKAYLRKNLHNSQDMKTTPMSNNSRMSEQDTIRFVHKKSKLWTHATKRMNLENMTLGERSQSQKTPYCGIPNI